MTLDIRTYVHCACGLWVNERDDHEVSVEAPGNTRCVHREELPHFTIKRAYDRNT